MRERANIELGRLIAGWRKSAGLSQASLADSLGIQQATVSKLEAGTARLTVLQFVEILDACGLSLSDVALDIERVARAEEKPLWERIDE